jgi:hypothetical protein
MSFSRKASLRREEFLTLPSSFSFVLPDRALLEESKAGASWVSFVQLFMLENASHPAFLFLFSKQDFQGPSWRGFVFTAYFVVNNKLVTSFPYLLCRAYFNLAF